MFYFISLNFTKSLIFISKLFKKFSYHYYFVFKLLKNNLQILRENRTFFFEFKHEKQTFSKVYKLK